MPCKHLVLNILFIIQNYFLILHFSNFFLGEAGKEKAFKKRKITISFSFVFPRLSCLSPNWEALLHPLSSPLLSSPLLSSPFCLLFSWGPRFGSTSGKEPACQCRRYKRHGFNPWIRKIPWRRAWQPIPIFLPGESHEQRNLEGYSL